MAGSNLWARAGWDEMNSIKTLSCAGRMELESLASVSH